MKSVFFTYHFIWTLHTLLFDTRYRLHYRYCENNETFSFDHLVYETNSYFEAPAVGDFMGTLTYVTEKNQFDHVKSQPQVMRLIWCNRFKVPVPRWWTMKLWQRRRMLNQACYPSCKGWQCRHDPLERSLTQNCPSEQQGYSTESFQR